jgi:predicted DsbA family dithiol-disulfide isomerase
VVFKNMVVHPQVVTDAHHAGCAAARQGKFVEFKNAFWDKAFGPYAASGGKDTASLGADSILKIAQGVGLDTAKLKADMDSAECKAQIDTDMTELAKWHVSGTPFFFINGKVINGALPKEAFKQVIDEKLKVAEASGVPGASYYDKEVMAKGEKQFRSKVDPKPH